ncbi:MAG: dTDP-4-dehydrorhamnose reductase [Anaerolineae bacterium]|nr:dTDP-4-dehydrorhamnose reductase [Anaerolineae bacterium]
MRIVITGHKGQLGRALQEVLKRETLFGLDLPEHDITDRQAVIQAIADFAPQVVIHAAAMTDVDGCERDPDAAYRINGLGTQNVALACQRCGAAMVYVSTNEVFDGTKGEPYLEFDQTNPINAYGRSKLAGEFFTRTLLNRFYIVRTAWLYAQGGSNFVTKMIHLANDRGELRVVADEISSPTYAPDLAEAIAKLIRTDHYGIYHFTNQGVCSRHDFAIKILELAGRGRVPVHPITSDQYARASAPPPYAPIRNFCAATALGITLRPWEEALQAYFDAEQ